MKKFKIFIFVIFIYSFLFSQENPLLDEFQTPFQVPPFDLIKEEHFFPAIVKGIEEQKKEIEEIANSKEEPDFKNTIEAMEKSGKTLTRASTVFYVLNGVMTNEEMQNIAKEIAPMISKHSDEIKMNEKLFQKIKKVYEKRNKLNLTKEQKKLLIDTYKSFLKGGANLDKNKKEKLMEINQELSTLSLKFGENVLKEENKFMLIIDKKEDLVGLPD